MTNDQVTPIPLIEINDATVLRSGKRIIDNLTLRINVGQHTAIVGPNGSGKTSLIKLITRQHYPLDRDGDKPILSVFGRERWNVFELRSMLGIVTQDMQQSFVLESIPATEAVLSGFFSSQGLARHHVVTPAMETRAKDSLLLMEADHLAQRRMETMSTGEARRILIARAMVNEPRALILDEPTSGLDIIARRHFLETLRSVANTGTTLILVTHHVEEILPEIDRVVFMKHGTVFKDGAKSDILTTSAMSSLFDTPIHLAQNGDYYAATI
jgi:iron complex transport system ATP-binding protein